MYISLNWLKDYISWPAKVSPEDLAAALTRHTAEVEHVIKQADRFSGVVVGMVLETTPHPNANRLKLVKVNIGQETLSIVCGAPNVAEGQLVPVATVGTVLPGGVEIKAAEIRGVKSWGMICAEDELGLGKEHAGIMVLNKKAKVGEAFSKYLRAEDIVLEIDNKSLSNRSDLLSHYGISRELSVIFNLSMKPYEKLIDKTDFSQLSSDLSVKVENKEACRRYQAVRLDNIKIEESPEWLKERLVAVGQRPVNNIVDLTNYVMLEIGQPLHAFDAAKVDKIFIRSADKNEQIITLDGQDRILNEDDLVIASTTEALALAGIMGGLNSGVSSETSAIILEAANFNAANIRKTSQKLGLRSESSLRFEKSLDPNLTDLALRRFLTLLKKVCPKATTSGAPIDIGGPFQETVSIKLYFNWLEQKLGVNIPKEKINNTLTRLGFSVLEEDDDSLLVSVPSWRATKDVGIKEDLAEEILRFYGYDKVNSSLPAQPLVVPETNQDRKLARQLKNFLATKHSLSEAENYSFVGEDLLTKLGIDFSHHLRLVNPLSEINSLLRRSLVPGLVQTVKNNQARPGRLGLFEIGNVFFDISGPIKKEKNGQEGLPHQETRLALIVAGESGDVLAETKSIIGSLFEQALGAQTQLVFEPLSEAPGWTEPSLAARVVVNNKEVGLVAMLSKQATANLNIKKRLAISEINFSLFSEIHASAAVVKWQEPPKYPSVFRDLAIVVGEKIMYNDLHREIMSGRELIKSAELFDTYTGDKLPVGFKSLAFHLEFRSADKTLTAAEVDVAEEKIVSALKQKFEASLREF